MAIILNALGEEGVRHFGIMVGFAIPFINVLAVSTLIWYSGKRFSARERIRMTGRALVSNPLILACIAGIFYARFAGTFPVFIDNALRLATAVTLPLALISIGGALTFETLRGHLKLSLVAAFVKLLIFPVVGYICLNYYGRFWHSFQGGHGIFRAADIDVNLCSVIPAQQQHGSSVGNHRAVDPAVIRIIVDGAAA